MTTDNEGARALALARSALTQANDAKRLAAEAKEGHRSNYEALGGIAAELARVSGGLHNVTERLAGVERLCKEGFAKLGAGVLEAKRAARKSGHELEQWKEDSTVTHLREELTEAKARLDSLRVRDKTRLGWLLKVVAGVVVGVVVAWLTQTLLKK